MSVDDLRDALANRPDDPAYLGVRRGRVRVLATRRSLGAHADALAAGLHARGIGAGDTVALAVRPGPAALAVVLAALRLRARVALVDPAAGPDLVLARLRAADARLVVADPVARAAAGWAAPLARRAGLDLPRLAKIARVVAVGPLAATGPAPDRRGEAGDALCIFTSGTTGRPRTVVHTVASLSAGLRSVTGLVDCCPGLAVLGGTFFVMAPALLAGAPVALPPRSTRALVSAVRVLDPQLGYLTPPQARDLLAADPVLAGRWYLGSAPVSAGLLERFRTAGADEAWGVYALTEAFPVAAVESREKSAFTGSGDLLGMPVAGMSVRTAEAGELLVSGPNTADRYLGEAPLSEVARGEVATGDRGMVADGRLVLHGRLKDMVLRRAENIYPGLFEPSLHVSGVALAVLVGVPGEDLDERLVLVVQPEPGESAATVAPRLRAPLAAMGAARPDRVVYADVPTAGRSRKPDRVATAALAAAAYR